MQYVTDQYHQITSVHRFTAHNIHKNIFKIDVTLWNQHKNEIMNLYNVLINSYGLNQQQQTNINIKMNNKVVHNVLQESLKFVFILNTCIYHCKYFNTFS